MAWLSSPLNTAFAEYLLIVRTYWVIPKRGKRKIVASHLCGASDPKLHQGIGLPGYVYDVGLSLPCKIPAALVLPKSTNNIQMSGLRWLHEDLPKGRVHSLTQSHTEHQATPKLPSMEASKLGISKSFFHNGLTQ